MPEKTLDITPSVTVHEMLETYPHLEDVLIGIAPPFKKLKNPLLRRSVARVATIKHISAVGKVPLDKLINKLRKAVGQSTSDQVYQEENYFGDKPDWFSEDKIVVSVDEAKVEDRDKMTLVAVMNEAKKVEKGEIIELITTFLPAPGIDILKSKGYLVWTVKGEGSQVRSYFLMDD